MKTALITGASGGIGAAVARRLKEEGYVTILHANRRFEEVRARAEKEGGFAVKADLSRPEETEAMMEEIFTKIGKVDVLVNNAGMALAGLLTEIEGEARRKLFEVDVLAPIECARACLPGMIHQKSGCIVNISSMWGQTGASCEVDYSAAKAALLGFTKALAKEVGPSGIRVNAIAPGVIRTEMVSGYGEEALAALAEETPLGRLGTPEEIAAAVAFLCSEEASFITGQVLGVNGGFVI